MPLEWFNLKMMADFEKTGKNWPWVLRGVPWQTGSPGPAVIFRRLQSWEIFPLWVQDKKKVGKQIVKSHVPVSLHTLLRIWSASKMGEIFVSPVHGPFLSTPSWSSEQPVCFFPPNHINMVLNQWCIKYSAGIENLTCNEYGQSFLLKCKDIYCLTLHKMLWRNATLISKGEELQTMQLTSYISENRTKFIPICT